MNNQHINIQNDGFLKTSQLNNGVFGYKGVSNIRNPPLETSQLSIFFSPMGWQRGEMKNQ
jgi:hypothetical protein